MGTINELSAVDSVTAADLLALFDSSNGDARKASLSALVDFLQNNITFPNNDFERQEANVSASAYSVTLQDAGEWIWLFINQGGNYAAGTVIFPATPLDQQEIKIKFSHTVTALTLNGNGKTIVNGPSAVSDADVTFWFKFDSITDYWYRI